MRFTTKSDQNLNYPFLGIHCINIGRNGIPPHFQSVRPSNFPLNFNNILPNNLPQSLFNSHQNFPSITNTASSLINNQENFPIIPISNTASSLVNNQENFPVTSTNNILEDFEFHEDDIIAAITELSSNAAVSLERNMITRLIIQKFSSLSFTV